MMKFTLVILLVLLTLTFDILLLEESFASTVIEEIISFDGINSVIINDSDLENYEILLKNKNNKKWYSLDNSRIYITETGNTYLFLMKKTSSDDYAIMDQMKVNVEKSAERYIYPDQDIQSDNTEIITLGAKISSASLSEEEKARNMYTWIIENISYDNKKYEDHQNSDFSGSYGALNTLKSSKGVCYDYATLYASLARSQGLYTKVIEGYYVLDDGRKELHAWNQVYLNGHWINVDTTLSDTLNKDLFDFEYQKKYIEKHAY